MPIFVILPDRDRKIFFFKIKERIKCSWEKFYPKYNISRPSFFFYLSGRVGIPKQLFEEWRQISKFNPKSKILVNRAKYCKKNISKIKPDRKLAEIFGILNGDGYLSPINYEICVVGNCHETDYLNYLKNLFENKFKIKFNFLVDSSKFKLRSYSIELFNLLTNNYGLPKGNKIGKLKIPRIVKKDIKFLISYIRGLFDTDGTFYLRRKKEPVLEISSGDKNYLREIRNALIFLGFKAGIGKTRVFIYNKQQIKEFFNKIVPANTKHLNKYFEYLKTCAGGPMARQ